VLCGLSEQGERAVKNIEPQRREGRKGFYLDLNGGRSCTACITSRWILFIVIVDLESGSLGWIEKAKLLFANTI